MDLGLDGKVALVTGASQGIGFGIAKELALEGARVAISSRTQERIEAAAEQIGARAYVHDTVDLDAAPALIEAVERDLGPIDILVTNTGGPPGGDPLEFTREQWEAAHRELVVAAIEMIELVVPGMRERGFGRVIFVGTVGSLRPGNRTPHYYAAKAALPNLTVGLAKELAGTGITVNTVSPGIIATDEVRERFRRTAARRGWSDDEAERRAIAEFMPNPSGRAGQVEEVGALVAFLASRHAGYINGANLRIDGGAADVAL